MFSEHLFQRTILGGCFWISFMSCNKHTCCYEFHELTKSKKVVKIDKFNVTCIWWKRAIILHDWYHETKIWNSSKNPRTTVFSTPFAPTNVLDIKSEIPLFLRKHCVHNYLLHFPIIYIWSKLLKISIT